MKFTKMHGAGNDYVYIDCFTETLPLAPELLAPKVSDRHFGIGSDGLVLIVPSDVADARMRMFNPDGSESEMCGNAIRCVSKYLYDHHICRKDVLKIETGAGILTLRNEIYQGRVKRVQVDMGLPILIPDQVPIQINQAKEEPEVNTASLFPHSFPSDEMKRFLLAQIEQYHPVIDVPLRFGEFTFRVTAVSMGNPHCVLFFDRIPDDQFETIGPIVESSRYFPRRTNVEFVEVLSPTELKMRVWERGTGETLACGTGACATAVAAMLTGRAERRVLIHLRGGDLEIQWNENGHVFMTGPATEVFQGELAADF